MTRNNNNPLGLRMEFFDNDTAHDEACKAEIARGHEPMSRSYHDRLAATMREATFNHGVWKTAPMPDCDTSYQVRNYHILTITVGRADGDVIGSYWCPGFEFAPELRTEITFIEGCKTFKEAEARLYEAVESVSFFYQSETRS